MISLKISEMSKNKLIVKNTIFLATRTIISLAISFYTTRIVLHQLGVSDYGLFSVIYGVVAFFVFIVSAMNDSVQRFISINLGGGDLYYIKDIIKNSIVVYFFAGVFFVLILISFKNFIVNHFLNIDFGSLEAANKLYIVAAMSIFISIMQTPFNALVLANEKMKFYAYMTIFDAFSKLTVSLLIVIIPYQKVVLYSVLLFISTAIVFIIYWLYCLFCFRMYLFGGRVKYKIINDIALFSFWNVLGNFAYVCRTQGINIVINIFFATTANAAYALSSTVFNAVNSLTQSFITALRPQIYKAYAEKNVERYNVLINSGSKYTFSILFVISCPVLLNAQSLLSLWLVSIPEYTVGFVRLIMLVALIDSFSASIITGIQATGRIKFYQLIVGFLVFSNLPISYILFYLGAPIFSMFVPLVITSILNMILRVYFVSTLSVFQFKVFYNKVVIPCIASAILALGVCCLIKNNFQVNGVISLLSYSALYSLISFILVFLLVVSKNEKKMIFNYFGGYFK